MSLCRRMQRSSRGKNVGWNQVREAFAPCLRPRAQTGRREEGGSQRETTLEDKFTRNLHDALVSVSAVDLAERCIVFVTVRIIEVRRVEGVEHLQTKFQVVA